MLTTHNRLFQLFSCNIIMGHLVLQVILRELGWINQCKKKSAGILAIVITVIKSSVSDTEVFLLLAPVKLRQIICWLESNAKYQNLHSSWCFCKQRSFNERNMAFCKRNNEHPENLLMGFGESLWKLIANM